MSKQHYQTYGLTLASELGLSNYGLSVSASEAVDIEVKQAECFAEPEGLERVNLSLSVSAYLIKFSVLGIADYFIEAGARITVVPQPGAQARCVTHFLLFNALPYCLMQRGSVILIGSAVSVDGESACLLLGAIGSGKSTLVAKALQETDAKLVSDQVVVLARTQEGVVALPGLPFVTLWHNVAKKMALPETALFAIRPNVMRYLWQEVSQVEQPLPVRSLALLHCSNIDDQPLSQVLKGRKKVKALENQLFEKALADKVGNTQQQAGLLFQLAQQIATSTKLHRVNGITSVEEMFNELPWVRATDTV